MTDPFSQLVMPLLIGVGATALFWLFNRSMRAGRPLKPYEKSILSHGFLWATGLGLLMAWNDELARLLHFQGRQVWLPLSAGWAVLLIYDASRRLHRARERDRNQDVDRFAGPETADPPSLLKGDLSGIAITALRFVLFFAVVGAIGLRQVSGYLAVLVLALIVWLLERKSGRAFPPPERR